VGGGPPPGGGAPPPGSLHTVTIAAPRAVHPGKVGLA
jgi:hypothetical protein